MKVVSKNVNGGFVLPVRQNWLIVQAVRRLITYDFEKFPKMLSRTALYLWLKDEYSLCSWDSITVDSLLGSPILSYLRAERSRFHVKELTVSAPFRVHILRKNFSNCFHWLDTCVYIESQLKKPRTNISWIYYSFTIKQE